jgi:redox-sensitive bicupin YhaK (pirin superfamily)
MPGRATEDRRHLDTVVDLVVGPRHRQLGSFTVNRVWPTPRRRLIGPFIFLDHLLPTELPAGSGFDVPPHPHIGLATVTWLFDGELMHADSLGYKQLIRPGDLNWMTAGRGITHSERSTEAERRRASRIHGMQAWVALPPAAETEAPNFEHVASDDLPGLEIDGAVLRLIAGRAFGAESPVQTASPLFYLETRIEAGRELTLGPELGERGIYLVSGQIEIDGYGYESGRLLVLANERVCKIEARESSLLMLLGGAPLEGDRAIWWNFVASDPARIEAAKADWQADRFARVPGDEERMPLPA